MQRIYVTSSNLASVGFENGILEIEFLNGSVYQYNEVSEDVYTELMSAASHGSYFNNYIRSCYSYNKV